MSGILTGTRIAMLATDGVERVELAEPRRALEAAGATVELLAPSAGTIQSMDHQEKSERLRVDRKVSEADPREYDGLVLPGGVVNADKLRIDREAVRFTRALLDSGTPIGVICHGPWILIETGLLRGRVLTSYPTLRTDLRNAGARWVDEEVHNDNGLVNDLVMPKT
jgi:protease I